MGNMLKNLWDQAEQHFGIASVLLVVVIGASVGLFVFRESVVGDQAVTLRNVVLVYAAALALPLAVWRSIIAHQQVRAAQEQIATAQRQAQTATDGLRHGRYQEGADMLGNANLTTRLGGLYALERLGKEAPDEYHVQVMKLLGAFVRHAEEQSNRLTDTAEPPPGSGRCRPDIETATQIIGRRNNRQIEAEERFIKNMQGEHAAGARFSVDLSEADLRHASLADAYLHDSRLTNADLTGARLSGARMERCNLELACLSQAVLINANLRGANARDAKLMGAELEDADLSDACLTGACLTKAKLRRANLSGSTMCSSQLQKADLVGANLTKANLDGAELTKARLDHAGLTDARLVDVTLTGASLRSAKLQGTYLTEANLSGADLTDADLTAAVLQGTDLTDACLDNANLCGVRDLTQTALDSARETTTTPPNLDGAVSQDGTTLVWRPAPLTDP